MYIDDCVEGIHRLMRSDCRDSLNSGRGEMVTINQSVDMIASITGKTVVKKHDLSKPQGVRGLNSDNDKLKATLPWAPQIDVRTGLKPTYEWIRGELAKAWRRRGDDVAD